MPTATESVIALDVGASRIGVAVALLESRLPRPLTTLPAGDSFFSELAKIVESEGASQLVVGFPRGLQGQQTAQTTAITDFARRLSEHFSLPINFQDESVTSKQAEAELEARGKDYKRGDIDALAATYILEDWLAEQKGKVT